MKRKADKWWASEFGYTTKKDLETEIRRIQNDALLNKPLGGADQEFMLRVLAHHSEFERKCGVGVKHIEVRRNVSDTGTTRGFWIVRADGTAEGISWVVALSPGGACSAKQNVSAACREAIHDQIATYREACEIIGLDCGVCGYAIGAEPGHIDHVKPFAELLDGWLAQEGLTFEQIGIRETELRPYIADTALAARWSAYHDRHAELRITHARCNLSRGRA